MSTTYNAHRVIWKKLQLVEKPYCDYCNCPLNKDTATVDHILSLAKRGPDIESNWALSCIPCQEKKAHYHLEITGMKLLRRRSNEPLPQPDPLIKLSPIVHPQQEEAVKKWLRVQLICCSFCDYCNCSVTEESAVKNLIVHPVCGGQDNNRNWAVSCQECADRKGRKLLSELGWKLWRVREILTKQQISLMERTQARANLRL